MRIKFVVLSNDKKTKVTYEGAWDNTRPALTPNQGINFRCADGQIIKMRVCTRNEPVYDVKENCMTVWLVSITEPTMSEQAWNERLSQAFQYSMQQS